MALGGRETVADFDNDDDAQHCPYYTLGYSLLEEKSWYRAFLRLEPRNRPRESNQPCSAPVLSSRSNNVTTQYSKTKLYRARNRVFTDVTQHQV